MAGVRDRTLQSNGGAKKEVVAQARQSLHHCSPEMVVKLDQLSWSASAPISTCGLNAVSALVPVAHLLSLLEAAELYLWIHLT